MTLLERLETARLALGATKANAILSRLAGDGFRGPTIKAQVEALENALEERFAQATRRTAPIAERSAPARPPAASSAEITTPVQKLCAEYLELTTDDQR